MEVGGLLQDFWVWRLVDYCRTFRCGGWGIIPVHLGVEVGGIIVGHLGVEVGGIIVGHLGVEAGGLFQDMNVEVGTYRTLGCGS